jgi:hypothetical protein
MGEERVLVVLALAIHAKLLCAARVVIHQHMWGLLQVLVHDLVDIFAALTSVDHVKACS